MRLQKRDCELGSVCLLCSSTCRTCGHKGFTSRIIISFLSFCYIDVKVDNYFERECSFLFSQYVDLVIIESDLDL